jgi:hypothetical protein
MGGQFLQRDLRQLPALAEVEAGVQLHQVAVARLGLRQQDEGRGRARLRSPGWTGSWRRDLAAEDRLDARAAASSENSSAQNMLLVSVTATAGMPIFSRRGR